MRRHTCAGEWDRRRGIGDDANDRDQYVRRETETWVAIVVVRYRDLFRMAAKPRATWKTPEAMKR